MWKGFFVCINSILKATYMDLSVLCSWCWFETILVIWLIFQYSDNNAIQNEVQVRFPTFSQTRFAPYTPRHTYRAPAGGARCVSRRRTPIAAIAKTFTKDAHKEWWWECTKGNRRSILYDSGRIANMVDFSLCRARNKWGGMLRTASKA